MELYLLFYKKEVITLHKMFTLDDLYNFYNSQNKTCVFNSKESNSTIVVQIPEIINFSDDYDPTYNLLPVHLMSCHLLENRNRSSISRKVMNEAIPSFSNRPILGYIQKIDDGDGNFHYDFAGHEMEFDENGNIEYKEKVVGVIPESCNPKIVHNDEHDKDYLEVDGLIYEDYTHAAEILRDKGKCDVSVEIAVDALSFDAKTKIMNIDQFHFLGVTILGVTTDESHEKIEPGMEGSNITISDFSAENNSFIFNKKDFKEEIISEVLNRIDYKLAESSPDNHRKEGQVEMDKENVKVEFEDTETEEVKVKEAETEKVEVEATEEENPVVETEASKEEVTDEAAETPEVVDDFADDDPVDTDQDDNQDDNQDDDSDDNQDDSSTDENTDSNEEEHQSVSAIEDEDSTGTRVENSLNYSVTINGVRKDFAVSLADKINAVTTLVNDTYAESDNCWYYCDVYEDDGKFCVMHDFWSDRHFRQEYSVKKDVYSLKGDRVQVYAQYLTSDEIAKLDKMKADFSSIESELNSYKAKELHSAREAVLASEDYSVMADFEEFKDLKSHMDEYSVEELTNKADLVYAKFMKSNYSTFATNEQSKKRGMVFMASSENTEEERLPYGGLFKNFKSKK